ncbi:MAG: pitrilysin family protein [Methylacidiphilales bacterium]|nr:pitrilysin family protein [Candidatus Methylacidiphilales bacterium]
MTKSIAVSLPIQEWRDETGARVLFVPLNHIPMVDIQVILPVGSFLDGKKIGLATVASKLIGTTLTTMSRVQFAAAFESTGASIDVQAGNTATTLSVRSLQDEHILSEVERLISLALSEPNPTESDLRQVKDSILHQLENQKSDAGDQAFKKINQLLFAGHPFSNPVLGEIPTVQSIELAEVKKIYSSQYTSAGSIVIIVGDLTKARAQKLSSTILNALPKNPITPLPPLPKVPEESTAKPVSVAMNTEQTHLLYAMRAPNQQSDDFYPLMIVNHIFGGNGFSSKLMKSIRSDEGLAYSASSWLQPVVGGGVLYIYVQTKNKSKERVRQLISHELNNFKQNKVSKAEFQDALDNLIRKEAFLTNSNKKIVELLATIALYNLPLGYLEMRTKRLTSISQKTALEIWNTHLSKQAWVEVSVGPIESSVP